MKKNIIKRAGAAAIIIFAVTSVAYAQTGTLPSFSLPDPQGGMHSSAQLVKNGLVVVVTAPTLHDKSAQEGWSKLLTAAKGDNKGSFIFIEDITPSLFKKTVRKDMKKSWKPGDIPILLIEDGATIPPPQRVDQSCLERGRKCEENGGG